MSPQSNPQDKSYWTHLLNRKSLFCVNDKAFKCFDQLAGVLQATEERDGSILHEKVCNKVVQDPTILALWDNIVSNDLYEKESFDLLIKTTRVLAGTYGRGNMSRKNNLCKNTKGIKERLAISHRASLV